MLKQVLLADETSEPKSIFETNLVEIAKVSKYYFLFNKTKPSIWRLWNSYKKSDRQQTNYRHISLLLRLYSASLNTQCGSSTPAAPGLSRPFKIYSHQIVGTISLLLPLSQLPCHLSFITSPLSFLISLCLVIRVSQLQTIHNSFAVLWRP